MLLPGQPEPVVRQYMDHPGAVAVAAIRRHPISKKNQILLLEQYRHPVKAKLWEIPAGLLDVPEEAPVDAAKRELREEADLVAERWEVLVDLFTSPGASDESLRVFLARDVTENTEPFERVEEEADMRSVWVEIRDAVQAILAGHIHNPTAIVGVMAAAEAERCDWRGLRAPTASWMR